MVIGKASIMLLHLTLKFLDLHFLSDTLAGLYVLSCADYLHYCIRNSA